VDLAQAIAGLVHERPTGVYHLTNRGSASRKDWAEEILRRVGSTSTQPATQAEYGAPFRKPQFSALANVNAARLGITLRPWQEALADHLQMTHLREELDGVRSAPPKSEWKRPRRLTPRSARAGAQATDLTYH
jgi:hypothetical protein